MTDIEYSRKERSISSWISIGSIAPMTAPSPLSPGPSAPGVPGLFPLPRAMNPNCLHYSSWNWSAFLSRPARWRRESDVQETNVLRVGLDVGATHVHVVAHEDRTNRSEEHTSELQS